MRPVWLNKLIKLSVAQTRQLSRSLARTSLLRKGAKPHPAEFRRVPRLASAYHTGKLKCRGSAQITEKIFASKYVAYAVIVNIYITL